MDTAAQAAVVAVIKSEKKTALAALTTAALSLPGLNASAAIPSAQIMSNVSYGHYQESDNRMQVDIYHADAIIPLSERIELAFSLDRDTYSGATPSFSMPENMTNVPKYKQKADGTTSNELSNVDVISAASGGVTAAGLTILGGLNGFQSFVDGTIANQPVLDAEVLAAKAEIDVAKVIAEAAAQAQYDANLCALDPQACGLKDQYDADITAVNVNLMAVPSILEDMTIDFNTGMTSASYAGFANNAPIADGHCAGSGPNGCYEQNGMVVGIVKDTSNPIAHLHRVPGADKALSYHSDSSGIYIRSLDSKAFSLDSMDFKAPISANNPDSGVNDYWEILGFNTALNPGLDTGDGTNYATRVAYQTVANGFNGTLLLNSGFSNINAAWIHYKGYPQTPTDGKDFSMALDNVKVSPAAPYIPLINSYKAQKIALTDAYNAQLAILADPAQLATLTANYEAQKTALTNDYNSQSKAVEDQLAKEFYTSFYRALLDSQVPTGTPTKQVFQVQPQETRSMPQVNVKYYLDATTLAISGGLSDEPDYLSNFGATNISHEFNDKLTTVSAGYGITSNTITRNGSGHNSHHASDPAHYPTSYEALNEASTFNSFNTSIAQVLSKNTLFQSTASYTNQNGYLSNPYKYVYVRGEITPEEYYNLWNPGAAGVDWNAVTNLEVVGLELFRENRPRQRNIFSLSNGLNHYLPGLDASAHFDYRFYTDDWGINSHTFEVKWFQSLPGGFTVTPSIRYYSQSQADFFAPYFLAPRADGNYSSDFRLSAFGDLSGGATIKKQFARGVSLEIGAEYVTHSGSLKLGGGGVGNYANFDYYLAHANLSVDLSAKAFPGDEHSGHAMHHHHGAPVPAGVMYGHMMSQAEEIMVGYRYQYNNQGGAMLHGSNSVNDQALVSNACTDYNKGCLYKPTSMNMQMHMLDLMYAPTDWLNIMLMPQLMSMDMTMSNPIRPYINQTEENDFGGHGGAKHFSNDIGDTVVTALVKVLDKNGHHVHLGLGMSTPTGSIGVRLDSSNLQDYGMQTGSGTWDFKPSLTYTGQVNDFSWGVQLSGVKRLEKNKYDYAYGDIFQATPWGSYQPFNWLSASVRGVYTAQGDIQGATNQAHQVTSTVDSASNYGGRFLDVGVGLNASVTGGKFVGHNVSFEWLQPVSTDYNGYQLNRNGALAVSWNYSF